MFICKENQYSFWSWSFKVHSSSRKILSKFLSYGSTMAYCFVNFTEQIWQQTSKNMELTQSRSIEKLRELTYVTHALYLISLTWIENWLLYYFHSVCYLWVRKVIFKCWLYQRQYIPIFRLDGVETLSILPYLQIVNILLSTSKHVKLKVLSTYCSSLVGYSYSIPIDL